MSYIINCTDGMIVRGETHQELLVNAREHIREYHPEQVGKVRDEDLLAQAVEV